MSDFTDVFFLERSGRDSRGLANSISKMEEFGWRVQRTSLEAGLVALEQRERCAVLFEFTGDPESEADLEHIVRRVRSIPIVTVGPKDLTLAAVTAGADEHLPPELLTTAAGATALQIAIARRRRWQALEASEARLRTLIQASAESLVIVDDSGTVRFANKAAEQLFERKSDELLGTLMGTPSGESGVVELSIVRPESNETIAAEMRVVEIEWQGQNGYIESIRDVTQHKKEAQKAREAIRMRDHFLATLSHELRNPLAAMSNAAQVLALEFGRYPDLQLPTEIVQRQCHHMVRLLDDLLDVSRISQGKVELRREFLSFGQLISDCLQVLRPRIERKHQFKLELPADPVYVHADPARMQQVLVNLLTNAIKYTPEGGEISLRVEQGDGEAVVSVSDQGHGIAQEMLDSIFEPFVQAEQTLARSEGGLGIGLAVVRRLVELHGGRVAATSVGLGHGSQFIVHLPLSQPDPNRTSSRSPSGVQRFRICVVEDVADIAWMLRSLLETLGHDVSVAYDGEQGLDMIFESVPDVVFLDIGLPGLSGYDVSERVVKDSRTGNVVLVAMTGYGSPEDRQRAFDSGFHYHLTKPASFESLQTCLTEIASKADRRS